MTPNGGPRFYFQPIRLTIQGFSPTNLLENVSGTNRNTFVLPHHHAVVLMRSHATHNEAHFLLVHHGPLAPTNPWRAVVVVRGVPLRRVARYACVREYPAPIANSGRVAVDFQMGIMYLSTVGRIPINPRLLSPDTAELIAARPQAPMPIGAFHHVGHGSAEHACTFSRFLCVTVPFERLGPVFFTEESAGRVFAPYLVAGALCERFGVAVVAGWRYLHASPPRVKSVRRPLNRAVLSHIPPPSPVGHSTSRQRPGRSSNHQRCHRWARGSSLCQEAPSGRSRLAGYLRPSRGCLCRDAA